MTFSEQYAYYVAMINGTLDYLMAQTEAPELLSKSMEYSISSGGKRLRPVLCLAACEMAGGSASDAVKCACALEMIHSYSLVHDDLPSMDNDDYRRGKPSNHIVFGEGNAILAGDGLLSYAFEILSQTDTPKAFQAVARGAFDMVCGQSMDINDAGNDRRAILEIHKRKTGALIRASLLAGIYSVPNNEGAKWQQQVTRFADSFGLLFQITDDILDFKEDLKKGNEKDVAKSNHVEHSSFVDLYGIESAYSEAKIASDSALEALNAIEADTAFLAELVRATLVRTA